MADRLYDSVLEEFFEKPILKISANDNKACKDFEYTLLIV